MLISFAMIDSSVLAKTFRTLFTIAFAFCALLNLPAWADQRTISLKSDNVWATRFSIRSPNDIGIAKLKFNTFQFSRRSVFTSFDSTGQPVSELSWYVTNPDEVEFKDIKSGKTYFIDGLSSSHRQKRFRVSDDTGSELGLIYGAGDRYFSYDLEMDMSWSNNAWNLSIPKDSPYSKMLVAFGASRARGVVTRAIMTAGAAVGAVSLALLADHLEKKTQTDFTKAFLENGPAMASGADADVANGDPNFDQLTVDQKVLAYQNYLNQFPDHIGSVESEPKISLVFPSRSGNPQRSFYETKRWYFARLTAISLRYGGSSSYGSSRGSSGSSSYGSSTGSSGSSSYGSSTGSSGSSSYGSSTGSSGSSSYGSSTGSSGSSSYGSSRGSSGSSSYGSSTGSSGSSSYGSSRGNNSNSGYSGSSDYSNSAGKAGSTGYRGSTDSGSKVKDALAKEATNRKVKASARLARLLQIRARMDKEIDKRSSKEILFDAQDGGTFPVARRDLQNAFDNAMAEFAKVESGDSLSREMLEIARASSGADAIDRFGRSSNGSLTVEQLDGFKIVLASRIECCQSILEIDPTINTQNHNKIYRKLSLRFHPDKFCGESGVDKDGNKIQHDGINKKINSLYDQWKRSNGVN